GMPLVGGPGPKMDAIAMIQFPLIFGIIIGSALSSLILKEFRIFAKAPLRQYLSAGIGGIIMGLASRMAPACNIWHLMGGLPILGIQSILFLIGLFPGAWLGSIILSRVVIK
ncbi:MAG: YeeE/YedE thiosulfate transporter family protein, partial [Desulfuromonadaceae bacterium]|nr:YeeE/YedE thiosulfate transporter family protein [Desulfuromonadaceae bacterium]